MTNVSRRTVRERLSHAGAIRTERATLAAPRPFLLSFLGPRAKRFISQTRLRIEGTTSLNVIPAKAGIQVFRKYRTPAFAGVTGDSHITIFKAWSTKQALDSTSFSLSFWLVSRSCASSCSCSRRERTPFFHDRLPAVRKANRERPVRKAIRDRPTQKSYPVS
jgi:hypothetical protein